MGRIVTIRPYRAHQMWVFDDPAVGLLEEPFVAGADTLLTLASAAIVDAAAGFVLRFSDTDFAGRHYVLDRRSGDSEGTVYYCATFDREGWLCPALFRYYPTAPAQLFIAVEPARG